MSYFIIHKHVYCTPDIFGENSRIIQLCGLFVIFKNVYSEIWSFRMVGNINIMLIAEFINFR
jgi:hypothetical protein